MKHIIKSVVLINFFCLMMICPQAFAETYGSGTLSLRVQSSDLPGFRVEEAGMSAYLNVGTLTATNLNQIMTGFDSSSVDRGTDYVLGTIPIANGFGNTESVYVYAETGGWIFAYLPNYVEASRMVLWEDEIGYNALEEALKTALSPLSAISFSTIRQDIGYYDFEFPDANAIMIVKDWVDDGGIKTTASYSVTMPTGVTVYEMSFALLANTGSYSHQSRLYFDNTQIIFMDGSYTQKAQYEAIATQPMPDFPYAIRTTDYNSGSTHSAALIIYKK
jgi:hypothetical protein